MRYGGSGVTPVVRTLLSAEDQYQAQLLGLALRLALTLSVGGATALESTKSILKDGQLNLHQSGTRSLASGEVVERRLGQLRKLMAEFGDDFALHCKS